MFHVFDPIQIQFQLQIPYYFFGKQKLTLRRRWPASAFLYPVLLVCSLRNRGQSVSWTACWPASDNGSPSWMWLRMSLNYLLEMNNWCFRSSGFVNTFWNQKAAVELFSFIEYGYERLGRIRTETFLRSTSALCFYDFETLFTARQSAVHVSSLFL